MGRYSKNLAGQKGFVFVTPLNVDYTAHATFAAFIASAAEGEIGVYLEAGTLKTTALAAGERFFIAQKKDGAISKTNIFGFSDIYRKARTAYSAPARKVVTVGYNATSGDIGLDFTGASVTSAVDVGLSIRETTPGNQPFPVQEARIAVTSTTYDEYTALASLASQLNGDFDYQRTQPDRFVKAEILGSGTLTTFGQTLAVVNGSKNATAGAAVTFAAGTKLSIAGTIYNLATAVSSGTAIVLDRPYQGATATVAAGTSSSTVATMAYTSGTTLLGLRLTGLYDEVHFVVTIDSNMATATVATATEWAQGSGSGDSIIELEKESRFFAGVGSVINEAFASDYGLPTLFAVTTTTYHQIFIEAFNSITPSAAPPLSRTSQIEKIILAIPATGNTPNNELQTIFAV